MVEDDTQTTCHYAVPFDNGDLVGLVVSTDGEDFFSGLTKFRDFPDGESRDLYDEQVLIESFDALSDRHFVLAEGTGRIIEIEGRSVRDSANLHSMLSGVRFQHDGSLIVWGPNGFVARRTATEWRLFPELPATVHFATLLKNGVIAACGKDGLFAEFHSGVWEIHDLQTNASILNFLETSSGLLIVGRAGFGGMWNSGEWSLWDFPVFDYYSLAIFKGEIYMGAGAEGLYVVAGQSCEHVRDLYAYKLRASEKFLAIAGGNEVVRFDGEQYPCLEFEEDIADD